MFTGSSRQGGKAAGKDFVYKLLFRAWLTFARPAQPARVFLIIMRLFAFLFCWLIIGWMLPGCANIIPPGGGPRDSTSPVLMTATPENGSTRFAEKRIVLTFDEYVTLDKIFENLLVNPTPKTAPLVESRLRTVTIRLRDSLPPNTTYSLAFGNAIRDVNEGNPVPDFLYAFSTGPYLDSMNLSGTARLAQTGLADTTLVAVLHSDLNDTAVQKKTPDYVARIDREGKFNFNFLPAKTFRLFVVPNDYSKRYDDSSKLFAFYPQTINTGSEPQGLNLLVYQEYPSRPAGGGASSSNSNNRNQKPPPFAYAVNAQNGELDALKPLTLQFNRPLARIDSTALQVLDTNYRPLPGYGFVRDTGVNGLVLRGTLKPDQFLRVIVDTMAVADSAGNRLARRDTLRLKTREESDYGALTIRFQRSDTSLRKPLLLLYEGDKLMNSINLSGGLFKARFFAPGDYEMRLLDDRNGNGKWDAGSYRLKRQPEQVRNLNRKLTVRPNYDNEIEIRP